MAELIADSPFIVISGHHPQKGKRERISKARSHITKQHFRRIRSEAVARNAEAQQRVAIHGSSRDTAASDNDRSSFVMGMSNDTPQDIQAMLSPESTFVAETTRRMYKFFDLHLHGSDQSHPFFQSMVLWSVNEPHFMSAKLLNASGWDDMIEIGELSPWTSRQRFITIWLLKDAVDNGAAITSKLATIAAFQSLLGFELLNGDSQSISKLQEFYQSLFALPNPANDDVWKFLVRGNFLLSHADRLRRAGDDQHHQGCTDSQLPKQVSPSTQMFYDHLDSPMDLSLFTFSHSSLMQDQSVIVDLISDLYRTLSIAVDHRGSLLDISTYQNVLSQHDKFLPTLSDLNTSTDSIDERTPVIRLSIFILTTCLLSSNRTRHETEGHNIAALISRLRTMLRPINAGSKSSKWAACLGALIWCNAIGLRFAQSRSDRSWFMMQFLRVSHLGVLEKWEEASISLNMIVGSLESLQSIDINFD